MEVDHIDTDERTPMDTITINRSTCVGCSLCINDCPGSCLYLEDGSAHRYEGGGCIECGHCYAICPTNSIRMTNYACEDEPVVSMTEIDSDTLLAAMRSRRTIRHYTDAPIEREKLDAILEAGRYAPTGANAQNVSFTILGSKKAEAESICVNLFRKALRLASPLVPQLKRMAINDAFFFKDAPEVIIISSKSPINAGLASAYMEIEANSLGLGILYSGFFVACSRLSRKLRRLLDLPRGHSVQTCMVIGYPAVKYQRIAPKKPAHVRTL